MENDARALYMISVAAELAGVHPQTLRIYERKGLLAPARTTGRSRRYSNHDIALLQRWSGDLFLTAGTGEPAGHGVCLGLAQARGLGLAAPFRDGLGEAGEEHGQP